MGKQTHRSFRVKLKKEPKIIVSAYIRDSLAQRMMELATEAGQPFSQIADAVIEAGLKRMRKI